MGSDKITNTTLFQVLEKSSHFRNKLYQALLDSKIDLDNILNYVAAPDSGEVLIDTRQGKQYLRPGQMVLVDFYYLFNDNLQKKLSHSPFSANGVAVGTIRSFDVFHDNIMIDFYVTDEEGLVILMEKSISSSYVRLLEL